MKAIIELLKEDFQKRQEKNPRYSLRSYANALGIHSGTLSHIMNGKRKISKPLLKKFMNFLGLSDHGLKQVLETDALIIAEYEAKLRLNRCCPWYYDAFLELAETTFDIRQIQHIQTHLQISSPEVRKMLKELSQLGRLKEEANNKFTIRDPDSTYLENLEKLPPLIDVTHMSSMSLKITENELEWIQERIKDIQLEAIRRAHSRAQGSGEVYQLVIQLFPVSSR